MDDINGIKPPTNQSTSTHWWHHRSFLEQILFTIALISSALFIATIIIIIILTYNITASNDRKLVTSKYSPEQNICLTPGCIKAAAEVLNYIDTSVDPCDNFYNFACGSWMKKAIIGEEEKLTSGWTINAKVVHYRLRGLIEKVSDDDPQFLRNVKAYYDACKNESEINRLGSEPLKKVIREVGGWPVVDKTLNFDSFDWIETVTSLRKLGLKNNIFISLYVDQDMRNSSHYIIELNQAGLGLDYMYLLKGLNSSKVSAYYKLMVDSAVMLGATQQEAEEAMKETLNFEIELAKIIIPREEERNISQLYNKMEINDLKNLAPEINWEKYLEGLLNQSISPIEKVVVRVPKYMKNLSKILETKSSSFERRKQKRLIANYMIWRIVLEAMPFLSKTWRNLYQEYNTVLHGTRREADRWLLCLKRASYSLQRALGSLYAQTYLNSHDRNQVTTISKYVLQTFLETIENLQWMDSQTREKAEDKANNMLVYMGYPDELLDRKILSEFYANLHLDPMSFYENHKRLSQWTINYEYSKLRKPRKRGDWENWYGIAYVNAFYHPRENALEIPGALFQSIYFSPDKPNYLNFGGIGSIIGHEITHGFDDEGRQFDALGNNYNWWEEQTEKNFKDRAECMMYQYGNYSHPDVNMTVNGINTLGENIADNAAAKQAYWAYKKWVAENGEEPMLPAVKYTPTQLFWISLANLDCEKYKPESLEYQIMVGSHSPSYNRVIGAVSNSEEFSKEFNCQPGSSMNPKNKCTVWNYSSKIKENFGDQ